MITYQYSKFSYKSKHKKYLCIGGYGIWLKKIETILTNANYVAIKFSAIINIQYTNYFEYFPMPLCFPKLKTQPMINGGTVTNPLAVWLPVGSSPEKYQQEVGERKKVMASIPTALSGIFTAQLCVWIDEHRSCQGVIPPDTCHFPLIF